MVLPLTVHYMILVGLTPVVTQFHRRATHSNCLCVFFASECLKFPSRTSRQVLGFFKTCHPVSLQLFLFLKLAVGLHHALPLLLHHPLSGHGRLVCGADGVPEKRVEQQRLGFLLEDRRREMRRHSKEFFTSTAW